MLIFNRWKVTAIIAVCLLGVLLSAPNLFTRDQLAQLPSWFPTRQVSLGLDLRGGSYLLLEVDTDAVVRERIENLADGMRNRLRTDQIAAGINPVGRVITATLRDPAQRDQAMKGLQELVNTVGGGISATGRADIEIKPAPEANAILVTLTEVGIRDRITQAVDQSIEIVRRRIDETGVNEPTIAHQGQNRILVQLPGVQDPDRIKKLLGTTAKMNFRLLEGSGVPEPGRIPPGAEILNADGERGIDGRPRQYLVRKRVEVSGANLTNARATRNNQTGEWVVSFEFDSAGTRRFAQVSTDNVNKPFAIVLDDRVLSAPVIREPITGGRGQISGSFTVQTANDLAVLLRAGALPAPLKIIEERTVGPDLGADAIRAGVISVLVGLVLVAAYMIAAYGLFGLFADIAVIINIVLTLAALSLLQATLTLPGIAGILLTVGMSVDANILINERIREETRLGKSAYAAMDAGFTRAFSTIVDSNLTTLIKMMLLFLFGSGVIKGFAVAISIGIATSMFTATLLVRLMMTTWLRRSRLRMLPV